MFDIDKHNREFFERAAVTVMPKVLAEDPGAYKRVCEKKDWRYYAEHAPAWAASPWTLEKISDYASTLDRLAGGRLLGLFDAFAREKQEAAAARDRRVGEDHVFRAELELKNAERILDEANVERLKVVSLGHQRSLVQKLEQSRLKEADNRDDWLAATQALSTARIELERQELLDGKHTLRVENAEAYVARCRVALATATECRAAAVVAASENQEGPNPCPHTGTAATAAC
jgi:hypothetical protein